ncbi:G-protein coupled receptor Mth [Lingula anatina]|uniref:G-protein coupled receptor Mth n=1 Tax=Lingula anatina TaxID=7574 RepID=A0A1S3K2C5_LINAN|nr:G-protein coupled receptor Mth [Lingula anatina]|eukprot:XP_013416549.1 G-protein coupled receptor Mth [Lingula anatina]
MTDVAFGVGEGGLPYSVLFDPNALSFRASGRDIATKNFKKCLQGQVFDVVSERCRQLLCSTNEKLVGNICVSVDSEEPTHLNDDNGAASDTTQNVTRSTCPKLNYTVYVHFQNDTLYVNATDRLYLPESFEFLDDGTVLVCTNLSQNISYDENFEPFSFSFDAAQVICSTVGLVISTVCLGLLLIIYSLLSTLRNLPGKILMCLVASLFVAQTLFLLSPLWGKFDTACITFAVLMHFSYLATFFWTNVMSFDICFTFSNASRISNSSKHAKKFVFYSIYGWGSALFVTLSGVVVDRSGVPSEFKPRYGDNGVCWITQKYGLLIFFICPVSLLLCLDLICFVLAVVGIRRASKAASFAKKTSEKRRLILYIKLSAVMGLTWITAYFSMATKISELWFLFIFLNTWLGVFIFLAFICNKKVYNLLKNLFGIKRREVTTSKSNTLSTTVSSPISSVTRPNTKEIADRCTSI